MNIGLGWLGVGVGLAGCLATFFMAAASIGPREAPRRTRLAIGLTLLLTILLWAIAMKRQPPFSEGQTLGLGFLIGGITGAAAILLSDRLASAEARAKGLAGHSIAFLALFGVSLTYSIFHGNPQDALIGFSIGAAMAAILGSYTQDSDAAIHIEAWALFGITLAIGVVLAVSHFNESPERTWWSLPILLATTVCIARFVGTELAAGKRSPQLLSALVTALIVLGLSAIYSWRIVANWQLLEVVALGIGVAAVVAWLGKEPPGRQGTLGDAAGRLQVASLLILLVMAFVVISFKLWSGLGIALGLIAAWSILGVGEWGSGRVGDPDSPALPNSQTPTLPHSLSPLLSLGLVILLFRLFIEQYRFDLRGGDFRIHYTFVGAMLGVVIPFLFASSLMRLKGSEDDADRSDVGLLASVGLIGLIAAATPILLFLVWDVKVVTGWMFGSTAAIAFFFMMRLGSEKENGLPASIVLLVAGAQLVAIKFIHPLSEIDLTRSIRIWTLAVTVAVVLIGLVITQFVSARRER